MTCAWILCACFLLAQQPAPLDTGLVRSIELEARPGTWVQHFRLDPEGAGPDAMPQALLRYVAGPDPAGGVQAELEIDWLAADLRVIQIEQASPVLRRLVFRELRARAGRTLFLEGTPEAGFQGYELGGREVVRRAPGLCGEFPLLLIESARLALVVPGEVAVLDPLAADFEPLQLTTVGSPGERTFEARRADGSLRWRVALAGERIREWRFQERGPIARAITSAESEALRERHDLSVKTAREAAAEAKAKAESARRPKLRSL